MKRFLSVLIAKENRKKLLLFCVAIALTAAISLTLIYIFVQQKWSFPEYVANVNSKTGFQSNDSEVVFDGTLDDSAWKNKRWLNVNMKTEESITVKMTSHFGSDGIYFAFNVHDPGSVYYVGERGLWLNSGIQLYVSSMNGAQNINDHGYEITLSAGGKTAVKKYTDGEYKDVPAEVYTAVKTDGEINTSKCNGYTLEAFISYSLFNDEHKSVFAMPAIIRSNTDAVTSQDRQWYCFGMENKGSTWDSAETWWRFDDNGLVAYDVDIVETGNGSISGMDYAVKYDDYEFMVEPGDGCYAESVTVNGEEVVDRLLYGNDGKAYYTVEQISEALTIKSTFKEYPEEKSEISGTVTADGKVIDSIKVYAVKGGFSVPVTPESNGEYKVSVPNADGFILYAAADGYAEGYAFVDKDTKTATLDLKRNCFGDNPSVSHPASTISSWDTGRLYENRIRFLKYDFFASIMQNEIYSSKIFAKAEITLPEREGVDSRAGFIFYDSHGNNVFVSLTMNNQEKQHNYNVQIISSNGTVWKYCGVLNEIGNQEAVRTACNSKQGVPLSVYYHDGKMEIWVDDEQIGFGVYPTDGKEGNIFSSDTKLAVGLHSWNNRTVFNNLQLSDKYTPDYLNAASNWDLRDAGSGNFKSLSTEWRALTLQTKSYSETLCVSGNIRLPKVEGQDTRAGYCFENSDGKDVFVALTMNNEKSSKMFYSVQLISQGGTSWNFNGSIADISAWEDVSEAAGSKSGVPFTVYSNHGRFTIGINGYLIADGVFADDASQNNILGNNTALVAGLQTWNYGSDFYNVRFSDSCPQLNVREKATWNLDELSSGKIKCNQELGSNIILQNSYQSKVYIDTKIKLPIENNKDTRSGICFKDESGNRIFVALSMMNENGQKLYEVQIISDYGKDLSWNYNGFVQKVGSWSGVIKASNTDEGVSFAAEYDNGKISVWLNNREVALGIIPLDSSGKQVFSKDTKVAGGLECWNIAGIYNNIFIGTERE